MGGATVRIGVIVAWSLLVYAGQAQAAEWRPQGLRSASVTLAEVQRAFERGSGTPDAAFTMRHEHYRYRNGDRIFPVAAAFRGDDVRVAVTLPDGVYAAGRAHGMNWRADANGVAHGTLSDDQGDAVDRLPRSILPFSFADCSLAGEATRDGVRSWVVEDLAAGDRPHWFFIDEATGTIVREETREGKRVVVTAFSQFATVRGMLRPRHWHVSDGDRGNDLDVWVDAVEPGEVTPAEVEIPAFAAPFPSLGVVQLPARFAENRMIFVDAEVNGRRGTFILDTGTASITLDRDEAASVGARPVLEHATIARMSIGGIVRNGVSVLAIPLPFRAHAIGILGYDFFFGHVVHIDYANRRVELLDAATADAIFRDPHVSVLPMDVDEGLPLVQAQIGDARGTRFALDTGSPHAYVLDPFEGRHAAEVGAWRRAAFGRGGPFAIPEYLEGSIAVEARSAPPLQIGPVRFTDPVVGVQIDNERDDAIELYFDGIVGTDELRYFDLWFDYDRGRIALRPNRDA